MTEEGQLVLYWYDPHEILLFLHEYRGKSFSARWIAEVLDLSVQYVSRFLAQVIETGGPVEVTFQGPHRRHYRWRGI